MKPFLVRNGDRVTDSDTTRATVAAARFNAGIVQRVEIGLGDQAVLIGLENGSVETAQPDVLDVGSAEKN